MFRLLKASSGEALDKLLFSQIDKDLKSGRKVILVVPAQASLAAEQKAFDFLGKTGFFDLRIMRGQKLQEEILHECGYPGLVPVNSVGRAMLLRKIAAEQKDKLKSFKAVAGEDGFIDMAGDFVLQLKQNNFTEADCEKLLDGIDEKSLLYGKLADMKLIFSEYASALEGRFSDSEDMLDFVASKLKDSKFIKEHSIYFHGFYSFTKRELKYLAALETCSMGLGISLLRGKGSQYSVTAKTEAKLKAVFESADEVASSSPQLPLLNKVSGNMRIVRCANPFSMAETIAADIRRIIREKNYSYSDIAVLTGNDPQLISSIKRVFSGFDIPVFADEKRSVLHNSAIEAVTALLDIVCSNYDSSDVIRFLKSGIMGFKYENIEAFEHYINQYHIKGDRFRKPLSYGKEKFALQFETFEKMRGILCDRLGSFCSAFDCAKTAAEKTACLYDFLENTMHLSSRLDSLALKQAEDGFLDAAEESSQVFDAVVAVSDQITELIGPEEISSQDFSALFKKACADVKIGVLPQAAGKVQLGSIGRSYIDGIKALYIAGFNDGLIPSDSDGEGILSSDELAAFERKGISLAKNADALYEEECFVVCRALSCATDYLWMGYLASDAKGEDAKPSTLLLDIGKSYPEVKTEGDILESEDQTLFLEGKDMAKRQLTKSMREAMSTGKLPEIWKHVYNDFAEQSEELSVLNAGLRYKNRKKPLGRKTASDLFAGGGDYSVSPSRMDTFAACPFRHFVRYGLKPEEQREFTMGGSEMGTIYHEALMRLCSEITDWKLVSDEEIDEKLDAILDDIAVNGLDGLMNSTKAEAYTGKRVRRICHRFARHMAAEIRRSGVEKMYLETPFARGGVLPAIELNTASGKVYVEGRIDRIDVCPREDGQYIRIIDYKSGNTKFNKNLVDLGLQLQLMVYLKAAMENFPKESSGGVYYFCIKDPKVSAKLEELPLDEISEKVLETIRKQYKLDGMDVDPEFAVRFSENLTKLCEKLTVGCIDAESKKLGSDYDSCSYCEYASICCKDIIS